MLRPGNDFNPFAPSVHLGHHQKALGDSVATFPAFAFALRNYPMIHFQIWPPDHMTELAEAAFAAYPNKTIKPARLIPTEADHKLPAALNKFKEGYTTLKTDLVDYVYRCVMDMDPPTQADKDYLQVVPTAAMKAQVAQRLGTSRYVVFTTNYTSKTRVFTAQVAQPVIDYVKARGFTPVFLGQKATPIMGDITIDAASSDIDITQGVNLLDSTTLMEAHAIMAGAAAVVGVDNGLLHLAAMTEVPVVAGFTNVAAATREPSRFGEKAWKWRSIEPPLSLACRLCQSRVHFAYEIKFTECMYGDYACNRLDPQEFISALQSFGV